MLTIFVSTCRQDYWGWLGGANNDDSRVAGADQGTSGGPATSGTDMELKWTNIIANTCMNMDLR